jgi:hypothetical protein
MSNNFEYKVGDVVERVSETNKSAMPLGHIGVVKAVDHKDPDQPIMVGEWYWPFICDIKLISRDE